MTRRAGMTMTEVLVALFIMALGVIAILTMFPLGMMNMANALRDDRTAQSAASADGYMRTYWKMYVTETQSDATLINAFTNPGAPLGQLTAANAAGQPSYPVFVDPIGYFSNSSPNWVAGNVYPRVNLTTTSTQTLAIRACSMLDGITYGPNGSADTTTTPGSVDRDKRYNWLWVLQRPNSQSPTEATMQVVVFERRSPRYSPPNAEGTFAATMIPGATSLTLPYNSGLMKGNWILDATNSGTVRQAYFYRVSSATDNGTGFDIELETPIRRIDSQSGSYSATIIVMPGVADVFTRPNLTP